MEPRDSEQVSIEKPDRGIRPIHLMLIIGAAAMTFPILIYLFFISAFMLMPGGFD